MRFEEACEGWTERRPSQEEAASLLATFMLFRQTLNMLIEMTSLNEQLRPSSVARPGFSPCSKRGSGQEAASRTAFSGSGQTRTGGLSCAAFVTHKRENMSHKCCRIQSYLIA